MPARRFLRHSFPLLALATVRLARARLSLACLAWEHASRGEPLSPARTRLFSPSEAAAAVNAVARRIPGMTCLPRALALRALLRRGGYAAELRLGVAKSAHGVLAAHAWVESEDAVFDCGEDPAGYSAFRARHG